MFIKVRKGSKENDVKEIKFYTSDYAYTNSRHTCRQFYFEMTGNFRFNLVFYFLNPQNLEDVKMHHTLKRNFSI